MIREVLCNVTYKLISVFTLIAFAHHSSKAQINITTIGTPVSQNFDAMGNSATATLPNGFRVGAENPTWLNGTSVTNYAAGSSGTGILSSTSAGGTYNFANGVTATANDRSLGFLTSGLYSSPRSIIIQVQNNTGITITAFNIAWSFEKYRSGTRSFEWTFSHGIDGVNWTANSIGDQSYAADANNTTIFNPPMETNKAFSLTGISISQGGFYYFLLTFTGIGGSTNGQAIGIDNFSVTAVDIPTGPISSPTDFYRSRISGNWNSTSTWESSSDNLNWNIATAFPTSAANKIFIRNGHTVTLNSNTSADQLTIEAGATLAHPNSAIFSLDDGAGIDLEIFGTYQVNGRAPAGSGSATVYENGMIEVKSQITPNESDDIAIGATNPIGNRFTFLTNAVFHWNVNNGSVAFPTAGINYFTNTSERPIFRVSPPCGALGGGFGNNTIINGFFEVTSDNVTWQNSGQRLFRDGFGGNGNINLTGGSIEVTGNSSTNTRIEGAGSITMSGTATGVFINNSAEVSLESNYTFTGSGFNLTIRSGGWLNCGNQTINGSANFVIENGGRLGVGSAQGISASGASGNIQVTGIRTFNEGGIYIYNGSANQITGNGLPNTVTTLIIANTGAAGSNTVVLTSNNTTVTNLELNSGFFASGLNQNLNIASGGMINSNGGRNPNDPIAGTITFVSNGSTQGNQPGRPELYSVIINGGVDFNGTTPHNATILNTLQINNGGFIIGIDAPSYLPNSNLIYNSGTTYGRGSEWGNMAGLPGYPHNVIVQNGTNLNLASGTPVALETGGDLRIGSGSTPGYVTMGNLGLDLIIRGNLIIGGNNNNTNGSILTLSTTFGSDLFLHGNFSRNDGSFFTDNSRAVFLIGSSNVSISTPEAVAVSSSNTATQFFSFLFIEKASTTNTITLNCPVAVSNTLHLTSGQIVSSVNNLLILPAGANYTGGNNDNSYVTGPLRKIGNTAFRFPVGKAQFIGPAAQGTPTVGGFRPIEMSAPGNINDAYTAEFFVANANLLGPIAAPAAPTVVRVSSCEYWSLDRFAGSSNTALNVSIRWEARSKCNVGNYVTNPATIVVASSTGTPLLPGSGPWNNYGGAAVGTNAAGTVTWSNFNIFNTGRTPFALASINQNDNPLPFRFTSFSATGRSKLAQLDWSVNINANIVTYTVERSSDGRNFSPVYSVNSTVEAGVANYRHFDTSAPDGWNYYRLRAIDYQGETHFSAIQKVWLGSGSTFQMSPNPTRNTLNITLSATNNWQQVQITNAVGQVLLQQPALQGTRSIDLSKLPAGLYYLRLLGTGGTEVHSFIKE